jgi:2-methylcitrate dehydratase
LTWEDSVEKFNTLVIGRIDDGLSRQIKDAVLSMENIQVSDLMNLLARINVSVRTK